MAVSKVIEILDINRIKEDASVILLTAINLEGRESYARSKTCIVTSLVHVGRKWNELCVSDLENFTRRKHTKETYKCWLAVGGTERPMR